MQKWIAARDLDDVLAAFEEAGAACAPIYDVEQLVNDPHVVARDTITTVDDEDLGPLKMQNLIFRLGDTPGAHPVAGPAARPGQRGGLRVAGRRRRAAGGAAGEGRRC